MSDREEFLQAFGWSDFFQASYEKLKAAQLALGRVIGQGKGHFRVQAGPQEILEAIVHSKLHRAAEKNETVAYPAVGDWILFGWEQGNKQASIQHVLDRKSLIQRKRAGAPHEAQAIAANVDYMFVVSSLDEDFNLDKLKRYFALGENSGAAPILLLTKSDLRTDSQELVSKCESAFKNAEVHLISNKEKKSIDVLQTFFSLGKTSVLIGSSGVGKSTLTNYLLGFESQKTQEVSGESRGRHTTTARNLLVTRWGGLVIDTPGMQDVSAFDSGETPPKDYSDIEETILRCKFSNCQHRSEPGCAISGALKNGTLTAESWGDYTKALSERNRGQKKTR